MSRCIGVFCIGFIGKKGDFEAGCYKTKSEGTKVLASRAIKFLSKSSAHRLAAWRCVGISAHGLAGLAICMDFTMKMGDFEAAPQDTGNEGKRVLASRATKFLSYLAAKLLSNLATWRLIA